MTTNSSYESALRRLETFLSGHFHSEFYVKAIQEARELVHRDESHQEHWRHIKTLIASRTMSPGVPLNLVNHHANQVIDENSDAEAYRWLDLMVRNIDAADGPIDEY